MDKNYLIILEINGLEVPTSMCIEVKSKKVYLYPGNYIQSIEEIHKDIEYLKLNKDETLSRVSEDPFGSENFFFKTGNDVSFFLVMNIELNLSLPTLELYKFIIEYPEIDAIIRNKFV
ncbi:MAG TPA: hypothetical protein VMV49_09430 [Candidatus Deferrimicrobium sp.]|nr:hypothetical protein [Candidatus Deferrimicrobium sp.]